MYRLVLHGTIVYENLDIFRLLFSIQSYIKNGYGGVSFLQQILINWKEGRPHYSKDQLHLLTASQKQAYTGPDPVSVVVRLCFALHWGGLIAHTVVGELFIWFRRWSVLVSLCRFLVIINVIDYLDVLIFQGVCWYIPVRHSCACSLPQRANCNLKTHSQYYNLWKFFRQKANKVVWDVLQQKTCHAKQPKSCIFWSTLSTQQHDSTFIPVCFLVE